MNPLRLSFCLLCAGLLFTSPVRGEQIFDAADFLDQSRFDGGLVLKHD